MSLESQHFIILVDYLIVYVLTELAGRTYARHMFVMLMDPSVI